MHRHLSSFSLCRICQVVQMYYLCLKLRKNLEIRNKLYNFAPVIMEL